MYIYYCKYENAIYLYLHRCNIPVILMGETGCGKTRLIKYMCELLSLNSPDSTTLVIMKVMSNVMVMVVGSVGHQ